MKNLTEILRANGIAHQLTPVEADPTILTLAVGGKSAVPMWKKLRSLLEKTNRWPVIMGAEEDAIDFLNEALEDNPGSIAGILKYADGVDAEDFFNEHGFEETADETEWTDEDVEPMTEFALPFDALDGRPHPSVLLALLPTKIGEETAAYLRMGNYNECPSPDVHVAVARYWNKKYGAEIVGVSQSIIEMSVARPPTSRKDALILARQQHVYCFDIVEQGVGSIPNLAATLLNNNHWYFWWD